MRNTFRIASVFNIEIRVDLSWALGFGAILWSLGGFYFPNNYPELSTLDAWTLALAVTVFLYISITAHELGHSLIAERLGVQVSTITLFIFGGLAHLKHEPRRARDELLIAIAGPIVSFVLAILFGSLRWTGLETVGLKLYEFGSWMGLANLSLALFNLIPGFPLDGGRILRAIVWGVTGNFERATRIAGLIGQFVAFVLIGWGVFLALNGHLANGFYLVMVGWFLKNASVQSVANIAIKTGLAGLTVREILQTDHPSVPPTLTLDRLVKEIAIPSGREWFPVKGGSRVTGVISLQEIKSIDQERWGRTTVGMIMKSLKELPSGHPDDGVYETLERMLKDNLTHLQVSEGGNWLGAVTRESIFATWRLRSELRTM